MALPVLGALGSSAGTATALVTVTRGERGFWWEG